MKSRGVSPFRIIQSFKFIVVDDKIQRGSAFRKKKGDGPTGIGNDPGCSQKKFRLDRMLGNIVINDRYENQRHEGNRGSYQDRRLPQARVIDQAPFRPAPGF